MSQDRAQNNFCTRVEASDDILHWKMHWTTYTLRIKRCCLNLAILLKWVHGDELAARDSAHSTSRCGAKQFWWPTWPLWRETRVKQGLGSECFPSQIIFLEFYAFCWYFGLTRPLWALRDRVSSSNTCHMPSHLQHNRSQEAKITTSVEYQSAYSIKTSNDYSNCCQ